MAAAAASKNRRLPVHVYARLNAVFPLNIGIRRGQPFRRFVSFLTVLTQTFARTDGCFVYTMSLPAMRRAKKLVGQGVVRVQPSDVDTLILVERSLVWKILSGARLSRRRKHC